MPITPESRPSKQAQLIVRAATEFLGNFATKLKPLNSELPKAPNEDQSKKAS